MDALWSVTGRSTFDVAMEHRAANESAYGQQPVGSEAKRAAANEEIKRVTKLPPTSTYASHRLRVPNKIPQLVAIQDVLIIWQRTTSQDAELELLFAGLTL